MKRFILLFSLLLALTMVMASQENLMNLHENSIILQSNDAYGLDISYQLGNLEILNTNTRNGDYAEVIASEFGLTKDEGLPQLPYSQKIISVPIGATVKAFIDIKSEYSVNLHNKGFSNQIIPGQPSVSKSEDINDLPFIIDENTYATNKEFEHETIAVNEIGILRGMRLFEVNYYPISYNPVSGEIKVINQANIRVDFINGDNMATEELRAKTRSFMFEGIYSKSVFNYTPDRMSLESYPLGYVIITPEMFLDTLGPFVTWKQEQGYDVTIGVTETIGATTTAIKSYIQGIWDAATPENPAPSYLLIVGDVPQVPAFVGTTGASLITDLSYVRLEGNDFLPEMYYGRFSANNIAELVPQVNKTLMYQKYEMPDPSYLERVTLIAGVDHNWASTHGNGTINYGSTNYLNTENDLDVTAYRYPQSGSSSASIIGDVNNGLAYLNYTAHGMETSWHDPSFTVSDVNNLTNANQYPIVIGNCCLTNRFDTGTCFGESWLRANNGAVIYIGGNHYTYWDEDYWWSVGYFTPTSTANPTYETTGYGLYDALFHEHGEAFEEWAHTAGAMIVTGNMTVQGSPSSRKNYYWEVYSIMGDPSTMPYIGIPEEQNVEALPTLLVGFDSYEVSAAPYSYVALSLDGNLLGTALTDESGNATINFEPLTIPGVAKLVITSSEYAPYFADVEVIPAEGPYLVLNSHQITGFVAAGKTLDMFLTVGNVGIEDISNINVAITNTDGNATINSGTAIIPAVAADGTYLINTPFRVTLSDGLTNGETITLHYNLFNDDYSWNYDLVLRAIAPIIEVNGVTISDDDNNLLDPGETADVIVSYENIGTFVAADCIVDISSITPGITILSNNISVDNLAINSSDEVAFSIQTSAYMESGTEAEFVVRFISSGNVQSIEEFTIPVGIILEDFESGGFSEEFNWTTPGWSITDVEPYEGTYCAKSDPIGNNQSATMAVQVEDGAMGSISFFVKVSSENNYDKLTFSVDNTVRGTWSGEFGWQHVSFNVSAGNHTFKWEYKKDYSTTSGQDCAWVDYIVFPSPVSEAGEPSIAVDLTEHDFGSVALGSVETIISNNGTGILAGEITNDANSVFTMAVNDEEPTHALNYFLDPTEQLVVTIFFNPTDDIAYSDVVSITSNDPDNEEIIITVNGVGEGVSNVDDNNQISQVTELQGNYPNPFNPETDIRFSVKEAGRVSLKIFNIKGQLVKTLVNERVKQGNHQIIWDGRDNYGTEVASGIYMYRLITKTYNQTKKMMLMK